MNQKQQEIILILIEYGALSSSAVHTELSKKGRTSALVTVKRLLSVMSKANYIIQEGMGSATVYRVTTIGRLFANIDPTSYGMVDPDKRFGMSGYHFRLFSEIPQDLFSEQESQILMDATREYRSRTSDVSPIILKKELERLVIELSWKSSKMEGNTYTLLDTERLLLEQKEAPGHDKSEAQMILNHKDAFTFVHEHSDDFKEVSRSSIENVQALLMKDLGVALGFRSKPVGVLGSKYRPLDNVHQLREAMDDLMGGIAQMNNPYAKALLALIGISYIQPFEDGNKRTSRLVANGILLAHGCAPLSYRSVDEEEYRGAILVFYEINSVVSFKKIFVTQYDFAARNYTVK